MFPSDLPARDGSGAALAPGSEKRERPGDDLVLPFQAERSGVMGRLVRLGSSVHDVLTRHDYPENVSQVLGEALGRIARGDPTVVAGSPRRQLDFQPCSKVRPEGLFRDAPVQVHVARSVMPIRPPSVSDAPSGLEVDRVAVLSLRPRRGGQASRGHRPRWRPTGPPPQAGRRSRQ